MKRYGLIGYPLGHSFSQRYFTEKFEREGIAECVYENFAIESVDRLDEVLERHPDLCGFNVTIPYKERIVPRLRSTAEEAEKIGAVNCIRVTPEGLFGYNTDAHGFRTSLLRLLGGARPRQALVLGTGGASKAVKYVLAELGIPFDVVSRTAAAGDYTYENLSRDTVRTHRLIVNATPLGTFPNTDACPEIPYEAIGKEHFLFDLVYNPPLTEFLRRGRMRGAAVINGYDMLVGQAEKAWAIWNGDE